MSTNQPKDIPKAISDCHQFLKWLIPQLDKFPRSRKFTLGERIESGALKVLEKLVEAAYSRRKLDLLAEANTQLDVLRHLWRLSYELKVISNKVYEYGSRELINLGRQMGAWGRYIRAER